MRVLFAPLLALATVLGGCGGAGFQTSSYDTARAVGSAPDFHAGEIHAFWGRVVDAHQHPGGYEIQLSVSTDTPTFVVNYPVRDPIAVHEGDTATVLGRVIGGGAGINGLGGYQRAVLMEGISVCALHGSCSVDGQTHVYNAWRDGTLQLGSRVEPAPAAASVVRTAP